MVQQLAPNMQADPLGQALGLGLQGAVSAFQGARQQQKQQQGLQELAKQLGFDEERAQALSGLSPDMAKVAFSALSQKPRAGEGIVTQDIAQQLSMASGGKTPPEAFTGRTIDEAKLLLRGQEVAPETEETKLRLQSANKFINEIRESGMAASRRLSGFAAQRAAVESGNVSAGSIRNFLADTFNIPQLGSADLALFNAGLGQLITDFKSMFPRLNIAEFETAMKTLLRPGQTQEAQLKALNYMENVAQAITDMMLESDNLEEQGLDLIDISRKLRKMRVDKTEELNKNLKSLSTEKISKKDTRKILIGKR